MPGEITGAKSVLGLNCMIPYIIYRIGPCVRKSSNHDGLSNVIVCFSHLVYSKFKQNIINFITWSIRFLKTHDFPITCVFPGHGTIFALITLVIFEFYTKNITILYMFTSSILGKYFNVNVEKLSGYHSILFTCVDLANIKSSH